MSPHTLEGFFRTYDGSVYRVMAGGRGRPSEARLELFESQLDFRFPEDFRKFTLSPLGGLYIEVRDDIWPRPDPSDPPSPRHQYGLKVFGLAALSPDWLDLREEIMLLPEEEADLVPFMARTGVQDRYCYDLDGQIVLWSPDQQQRTVLDLAFTELCLRELEQLADRHAQLNG